MVGVTVVGVVEDVVDDIVVAVCVDDDVAVVDIGGVCVGLVVVVITV